MFQRRTLNVDPLQQTCHSVTQAERTLITTTVSSFGTYAFYSLEKNSFTLLMISYLRSGQYHTAYHQPDI